MRPCHVLRVFTSGADGGNHLGVVLDTVDLDTDGMQAIAADLGFSESTFVEWAEGEAPLVRIFTPATELQFAGHPMVGTGWVLGTMGPGGVDRMRCGVGYVGFTTEGDTTWVATELPSEVEPAEEGADIAARAGLPVPVRAWWSAVPQRNLVLDLGEADAVAAADPDLDVLRSIDGAYLVAGTDHVKARYFAPKLGVDEDPATGSAAVCLAAVRVFEGQASGELSIDQGAEVGMPSRIGLRWGDGMVHIGGTVVRDEMRVLED